MKQILALILMIPLLLGHEAESETSQPQLDITAKSAILMEADTGTIIYEKNPDEVLSPASITKIMTLILIFDALETGKITMEDQVVTSAHAKSMGGSQVFLEEGEVQTVETMIKCIVIASGNDASVAMAEHISGSEAAFVEQMNQRAQGLGMTNTHFEDCCGLTDSDNHYSTAKDVAIMSRELITNYPKISEYATIWMENITHVTRQGSKEFGLSNTNKLLKMTTGFTTTGLKTGSTSKALYCLSATAIKDDMELIAVVMAAPDYKVRFQQAVSLLNYGYSQCRLYKDEANPVTEPIAVQWGKAEYVDWGYERTFSYLSTTGEDLTGVVKTLEFNPQLSAPLTKGQVIGQATYTLEGKKLGSVDLIAREDVEEAGILDYLQKLAINMLVF